MKEMVRLKTITSKGKILLSPFVFEEEEGKRRIKNAAKTFEKGSGTRTELLSVTKYPRNAVWSEEEHGRDEITVRRLISFIKMLELEWEVRGDVCRRA